MPAWYEQAFGAWYLRLYSHRDREEAVRTLEILLPWIGGEGPLLDVACGAGRHLEVLAASGIPAFGLDRSGALLGAADTAVRERLVRGDMRQLPFRSGFFRAVLSLFTSFGYFENDEIHRELLREFGRVSRPDGVLVLDLVNPPALRRELVPQSSRRMGEHTIRERRALEAREGGERVVKDIVIQDAAGDEIARFREEVALYERGQLGRLLAGTEWKESAVLGDYEGNPWSPESPRLIVVAGKDSR